MTGFYTRVRAVFLTIDSAAQSGVELSYPVTDARDACRGYEVEAFGLVKTPDGRAAWVRDAVQLAKDCGLPLIIVGEQWTRHGLSNAAYKALNERWGKWEEEIERLGVMANVVRVYPQTWRAAVFGKSRPRKSADLKRWAVKYVELQLKQGPNIHDDIAEALCIRVWAERAPEVHALLESLKKKKRKKVA